MGFRCELTGKHVQGKPRKIVIERRERTYHNTFSREGKLHEKTSRGWEIGREIMINPLLEQQEIETKTAERYGVRISSPPSTQKTAKSSVRPFRRQMEAGFEKD